MGAVSPLGGVQPLIDDALRRDTKSLSRSARCSRQEGTRWKRQSPVLLEGAILRTFPETNKLN